MKLKLRSKFYEEQIDALIERIKTEEYGSEEYTHDMENLEYLLNQHEKTSLRGILKDVDWKAVGIIGIGLLDAVLIVRGQNLERDTAKLAWLKNQDMELCDNMVYNSKRNYPKPKIGGSIK